MSCSGSPKPVDQLAKEVGEISIGEEATDAVKSPPLPIGTQKDGTPKEKRNAGTSPKSGSPKVGSPGIGSPKNGGAKSPKLSASPKQSTSPPKVEDGVKNKEDITKADGSPKDEVFEDGDGKKSGEEQDEKSQEPKERRRSRTNSYRYRNPAFAGMVSPPFRDNYFKHGPKSETDDTNVEGSPKKQIGSTMPKHDRPGFFVGRTRHQSEKSTEGGEKKEGGESGGEQEPRKRRPRNRRRGPPPDMDMSFYQPPPRGNFRGNYYRQASYQPQPYYQQGYNNYYQGQPFQQRPNFNRFYSQPGNYGGRQQFIPQQQQRQQQYMPRAFRNQQGSSSSFYDTFGGDQPQKQRKQRARKNRSRTNSKRDRTASTASNTNQATEVKGDARDVTIAVKST